MLNIMCLFIVMSISVRWHKLWCTVRDMHPSKCSIIIIVIITIAVVLRRLVGMLQSKVE